MASHAAYNPIRYFGCGAADSGANRSIARIHRTAPARVLRADFLRVAARAAVPVSSCQARAVDDEILSTVER